MKHILDGIHVLRRIYKPSEKFVIKSQHAFLPNSTYPLKAHYKNYDKVDTVGETNGQHTSFSKKCCPLVTIANWSHPLYKKIDNYGINWFLDV
jgi:hypothetical protein